MKSEFKDKLTIGLVVSFLLGIVIAGIALPDKEVSISERRKLTPFPKCDFESISNGSFMREFETYALDHFPIRDHIRSLKAIVVYGVMEKKDNNDIFVEKGQASKIDAALNEESLDHAIDRFDFVYNKYLKNSKTKVYLSIVPDKNYYLAENKEYPAYDYEKLVEKITGNMSYAEYIDIMPDLSAEDYYRTDTHWCQERIENVAKKLGAAMGTELLESYNVEELQTPFYGVYYGQSALPMKADIIRYIENKGLDQCRVFDYEKQEEISLYNEEASKGPDGYEFFLSGPKSLLTIENEHATTDKELILFRDSYGSSIAPYFVEGYRKITLVDIRYISPHFLEKFIDFENQDVLFLYSTSVLNNSITLK